MQSLLIPACIIVSSIELHDRHTLDRQCDTQMTKASFSLIIHSRLNSVEWLTRSNACERSSENTSNLHPPSTARCASPQRQSVLIWQDICPVNLCLQSCKWPSIINLRSTLPIRVFLRLDISDRSTTEWCWRTGRFDDPRDNIPFGPRQLKLSRI